MHTKREAGPKAATEIRNSVILSPSSSLEGFKRHISYTAVKMLRTATASARLLSRVPVRQISTSPALQIKIRSSAKPTGTPKPNPTSSSQPSPAEAPPAPPPETSDPSTFTPEVRQSTPTPTQTPTPEATTPPTESNTPLTPPAVEEEISAPKDGKYTLPSLDIDPEAALPEPVKEESEGSGKKRTGAGRKEYVSSIERQRKLYARVGLGAASLLALGAAFVASQDEVSAL